MLIQVKQAMFALMEPQATDSVLLVYVQLDSGVQAVEICVAEVQVREYIRKVNEHSLVINS